MTAQQHSETAANELAQEPQPPKQRFFRWPTEQFVLTSLFRSLLVIVAVFAVLDFQTIYERANAPLPGEAERTGPMFMDPPSTKDHLRPYLPRATPVERNGREPKMPGFAKPVKSDLVGKRMQFVRGPNGRASAIGRIEPGTSNRFAEFLEAQKGEIIELYLHSPGGSVSDALAMSRHIREQGLKTVVPASAYCASSCPLLLAGGIKREASPKAWVGVHRIYTARNAPGTAADGISDAQEITANIQQHLIDMGIKPDVWLHAMRTPSAQLYIFTPKEMADYQLTTARRLNS